MRLFLLHGSIAAGITFGAMLAAAAALHTLPRLGRAGRRASEWMCHAPGLDWVVAYFTVLPLIVGPIAAGWAGLVGAIVGQVASVQAWVALHEWANRDAVRGPRI